MSIAWDCPLHAHEKIVLLALCDFANDEGWCYPSIQRVAAKCSMDERTIQRRVSKLEKEGYLSRQFRSGKSTVFILTPGQVVTPGQIVTPGQDDGGGVVRMTGEGWSECQGRGGQDVTHNHHLTIKEPPTNQDNYQQADSFVGLAPNDSPPQVKKQEAKDNTRREQLALAKSALEFLNKKTGRHYQPVPANIDFILARIREGATKRQLFQVIAKKNREWSPDPNMAQYLRPATLFNRSKFAQYVGELIPEPDEMTETKEANHG